MYICGFHDRYSVFIFIILHFEVHVPIPLSHSSPLRERIGGEVGRGVEVYLNIFCWLAGHRAKFFYINLKEYGFSVNAPLNHFNRGDSGPDLNV